MTAPQCPDGHGPMVPSLEPPGMIWACLTCGRSGGDAPDPCPLCGGEHDRISRRDWDGCGGECGPCPSIDERAHSPACACDACTYGKPIARALLSTSVDY